MSSISRSIGDYLKETKSRASLAQFVDGNKEQTKLFIRQFDSETQATNNLVNKYAAQFKTTYPARKRVTGKQVNLGIIYAEARVERSIQIESYKALETGVSVAGRGTRGRISGNNGGSVEDTEDTEDTGDTEEVPEKASNGYNIIEGFNVFREEARTLAESQGLFINGNLQQLLQVYEVGESITRHIVT
ncbi:hypothetical protein BD770DRAFT_385328 [Pilaira anomala]|nr:hypothetical protein BD770DRAFT_385328 [Pilaira anomala]